MFRSQPRSSPSELCIECSSLDLTPRKFQGLQDGEPLAPGLGLGPGRASLRYRHKLKRKIRPSSDCRDCPFCTLVNEQVSKAGVSDDTECLIEWVLDGHQTPAETVSRRIRISWSRPNNTAGPKARQREELYVVYAPPHSILRKLVPTDAPGSLDRDCDGYIYLWIKKCISLCDHKHHNRIEYPLEEADGNDSRFLQLVCQDWFYVLDVHDMKLTELPVNNYQPEQYVALSYRWGSESTHMTNKSNFMQRKDKGGLDEKQMPPTIQHAIELVRTLALKHGSRKLRFIWIDSLCIIQNDSASLLRNAEKMHLIFRNANFTICAADEGPGTGLRAMRSRRILDERAITKDLKLLVSRSPESVIQASDWNTRAWTFQERILSRRCLVFAGNRIYFQCRKINYDDTGIGWSSDWRKSPLWSVAEVKDRPIRFYMNLRRYLEAYSMVHLYSVFFGLPSTHFDFAMLWRPHEGKLRRLGYPDKNTYFPSWSWSGWQREEDPGIGTAADYPLDILEGALIDLHRWLLEHTWIIWHIRDRNGDLQPLWRGYEPKFPERAQKMLPRWRGYEGYQAGRDNIETDAYGRRVPHSGLFLPRMPTTRLNKTTSQTPILQSFTWKCDLYIVSNDSRLGLGEKLVRADVLNQHEDWCGTVVVDESWAKRHDKQLCEFIALSDTWKFTEK